MLDDNNKLKIIDFGTAEVFRIPNKNEEFYKKYLSIRETYKHEIDDVMEFRQSAMPRKSFVGTVYYVAPEMLEHQSVDKGCDFWALGVIIYKMLTGKYLFNDTNEYFIFQRIRECNYKMDDDIPDEAKDIINQLLKKESSERLGNGSPEDGRDIEGLKDHPFFTGYDFSDAERMTSPIKLQRKPSFEIDPSPENQLIAIKPFEDDTPKIVLSGLVKKMKYLFLYNTRQLILYSNGTLEYFDPKNNRVMVI